MKADERKCPACAEAIKKDALVCKHCGERFSRDVVDALKKQDENNKKNGMLGCIGLIAVIALISQCGGNEGSKIKSDETAVAEAEKKSADRRKGFHCLSGWDGANLSMKQKVKEALRNPDSFEHVETRIAPVNEAGRHPIFMKYRAQNGFGGMNVETAAGVVDPISCDTTVLLTGG